MDRWKRLERTLGDMERAAPPGPATGRWAAALALLAEREDGDLEIVYTRRRDDLANHPGQISFPGGRVDAGETTDDAALREAMEEIGLDRATVTVVGRVPAFYIPPSRFWLQVVVARWNAPHELVAAESEVAEILHVPLARLRDPRRWRTVRLSHLGSTWAWQLDERHVLWGATGVVTGVLLGTLDPAWSGGVEPAALGPDLEVRPWEAGMGAPGSGVPRPGTARVPGVEEVPIDDPLVRAAAEDVMVGLAPAAAGVATAVRGLVGDRGRSVAVLVGPGGTGKLGRAAAELLTEAGAQVRLVESAAPFGADAVAGADVVVDALVGRGLDGPIRGSVRELAILLREHVVPVVSVDVPTGLHPSDGLIGDLVTADVTVAVGAPAPGLFGQGLGPFVGDLYLAAARRDGEAPLVRLVPGGLAAEPPQDSSPTWRE